MLEEDDKTSQTPQKSRRVAKRPSGPAVTFSAASDDGQDQEKPAAAGAATAAPLFKAAPPPPQPAAEPAGSDDQRASAPDEKQDERPKQQKQGNQQKQGKQNNQQKKKDKQQGETDASGSSSADDNAQEKGESGGPRRRRRRRRGDGDGEAKKSSGPDQVTAVKGSTRIEAKRQRRREGRESGRRRAPVLSEAEFLARREAVKRDMVVRQDGRLTQIAVLEDDVLVEHYVNRATVTSTVGHVYLGRVQNVLPSMEAAFVDVGAGRNAVLYAGEVNWQAAGMSGQPKRIEKALSAGDKVLVQVTKDPVGHKGARLTSQISLPGRFVVLVPDGSMTGISRKLPDKERSRLRAILKRVLPEGFGVIVRTAAEGASEENIERDVSVLTKEWERIQRASETSKAPALLHSEPDLALRVVRDIFNSDFESLVVSGDEVWTTLKGYIDDNAPDLSERLTHWTGEGDVFAARRIDEQLSKALDRKVYLPSGGSLVIDHTEAMTVVDVNTGRFTGQGGNLEETVTKNNLEAAEEVVRQLRLRDVGGIIVIDFIDMVLEDNRDLVVRRLVECLSRDRTKHQVSDVSSLGLVQMTRKRIGQGLLETFGETCDCCQGRGIKVSATPVEQRRPERLRRPMRPPGAHDPVEAARRAAAGVPADAGEDVDEGADEELEGVDEDDNTTGGVMGEEDVDFEGDDSDAGSAQDDSGDQEDLDENDSDEDDDADEDDSDDDDSDEDDDSDGSDDFEDEALDDFDLDEESADDASESDEDSESDEPGADESNGDEPQGSDEPRDQA